MPLTFRHNIETMTPYVPGYQPPGADVIKLNTNENPYPPSPAALRALAEMPAELLRKYPPAYWDPFRQAAADVFDVDPTCVACGNGGDEILTMLVRCCCDSTRPVAYPAPTYTLYRELAEIQDCSVIEVPFDDLETIPAGLSRAPAGLTIICNPNAPTGTVIDREQIADLARSIPGVLLIDEAYVDFAELDCLDLIAKHDNVVILRSMSKGYSLAGLRFGFAIGAPAIIAAMSKVKDSYNVNVIAQHVAAAALRDQDNFAANVAKIKGERDRLTAALRGLGLAVPDSQTNFLLVDFTSPTAATVHEQLSRRNIYVRYFNTPNLAEKLRITVGTPEQNNALIAALKEIL